jgi:hypothetical protein
MVQREISSVGTVGEFGTAGKKPGILIVRSEKIQRKIYGILSKNFRKIRQNFSQKKFR